MTPFDCPGCEALGSELCPECAARLEEYRQDMNDDYWNGAPDACC